MSPHAKHLSADVRRELTVEAVVALSAEQNPADITTAAIAQRMGLTQGAVFRHFRSKEEILGAVMDWVAERLLRRLDEARATATDVPSALEAMFLAHAGFVAEHPGAPRMLLCELQRAEDTTAKRMARTLIAGYGRRLAKLMEDGKRVGELDADLEVDTAVMLFIGSIQGLVMQGLIADDLCRISERAPAVFALYRRAIGA